MKKTLGGIGLAAVVVLVGAGMAGTVQAKETTWTGWISDSYCAAKGANAGHKGCAEKCVKEKGASWVFVYDGTQKVLKIENQEAVNAESSVGQEVKVTGELTKEGELRVERIAPAK
jgi:hypothetical protein